MTNLSRDPLSQVDAGWDDVAQPSGVAALPTSSTPPSELDALDDGWSAAAHSAPAASAVPIATSGVDASLAAATDSLDDGWGEDDDSAHPAPRHSQRQVKQPASAGKKAKRKLARELKAQQIRTEHLRSQTKKESRRDADKRRRAEADKQAAALRQQQEARRAAKPAIAKPAKPKTQKQVRSKDAASAPRLSAPETQEASVILPQAAKAGLPGSVLWAILIVTMLLVGYWVTRR